jgi:ribose transport system substrate-binding protein
MRSYLGNNRSPILLSREHSFILLVTKNTVRGGDGQPRLSWTNRFCFRMSRKVDNMNSVSNQTPEQTLMFPKRINHLALVVLLLGTILATSSCSSGQKKAATYTGAPLKLAFVSNATSDDVWRSLKSGAEKVADELTNVEIVWRGPDELKKAGSQSAVINRVVELGVDGIVLAPSTEFGLADAVEDAIAKGIPVLVTGDGLGDVPNITAQIGTDNYNAGKLAATELATAIGEAGNVILLRHLVNNKNSERRAQGFLDGIDGYSKIKVVSSDQRGGDSAATAKAKINDLLLLFGEDLAGVCAIDERNAQGTLGALREKGLAGQIKLVAIDPNQVLVEGLADGTCSAIVLQDPFQIGYQSVLVLVDAIQGKPVKEFRSTGEFVVTSENVDDKTISKLLKDFNL